MTQLSPFEDSAAASFGASEVLSLHALKKSFGSVPVLDELSLSVNRGEVFGFLGRNGAGKSTAIRTIMGITKADSGTVKVFGQALHANLIKTRQRIGYVAQDQNMYPWMSPKVISRFVRGFYPRWDEARYRQLLNDFGLPPKRRLGTFSGGMKAKLALTLALATRPELLILDEPTAGMDPVARREFLDLVREQTAGDGATTFFSTHLIDEIEAIAGRIAIVEGGKTLYEGGLDPLRNSVATWSIDSQLYQPFTLPGEFARHRLRILFEGERRGRYIMTMQFDEGTLATQEIILNEGWRHETMSLEDVFIAIVSQPESQPGQQPESQQGQQTGSQSGWQSGPQSASYRE